MAQKDWKYVFTVSVEDEDNVMLTGPYEDADAAQEFIDDTVALIGGTDRNNHVVLGLDEPDAVLAALKKDAKRAKKAAKKAAKAQAAEKGNGGNGNGKKGKKNKKGKKAADTTSPDEGEVGTEPQKSVSTEQGEQAESEAKAAKQPESERYNGSLADDKDKLIESWSRAMTKHDVIGPLNLTPQQRRVIAALKWRVEVNKSNAHMPGTVIPPPPIVGLDNKGRLVVQGLDGMDGLTGKPRQWAVLKNGDPTDIATPVQRLKKTVAETV